MKRRLPDQPSKQEPAVPTKPAVKSGNSQKPNEKPSQPTRPELINKDIELISKKLAAFGSKGIQPKAIQQSPPPKRLGSAGSPQVIQIDKPQNTSHHKQLGKNPKIDFASSGVVAVDEIHDSVRSLEEIDEESVKFKPKGSEVEKSDDIDYSRKPPTSKPIRVADLLGEEPAEPVRKSGSRPKKSGSPTKKVVTKQTKKPKVAQEKLVDKEVEPKNAGQKKSRPASKKKQIAEPEAPIAVTEETKPKPRSARSKKAATEAPAEEVKKPAEVPVEPVTPKKRTNKSAKKAPKEATQTETAQEIPAPETVAKPSKRNRSKSKQQPLSEQQALDDLLGDPIPPVADATAPDAAKPKKEKKKPQKSTVEDELEKEQQLATTLKVNFSSDYSTTKVTYKHSDNREFTTRICDFLTDVLAKPTYGREPPKLEEGFTAEQHIYYDIPSAAYYPDLLKHLSTHYTLEYPRTLKEYFHVKPEGMIGELGDDDFVTQNNDFEFSIKESLPKKIPLVLIATGDGRSPPPVFKGVKTFTVSKRQHIDDIVEEVATAKKSSQRVIIQVENWETLERSLKGAIFGLLIKPQLANEKGLVNEFPLLESRFLCRPDPTEIYKEDRFTLSHELRIVKTPNTHVTSFQTISDAIANKDQIQLLKQVCKFTKKEPKQVLRDLELSIQSKSGNLSGPDTQKLQSTEEKLSKMVQYHFKQSIEMVKSDLLIRELSKELLKFKRVIIFAAHKESMKELGASITRNLLKYGVTLIEHDSKKSIQQINELFLSAGKTIMIYPITAPKKKLRGLNFDLAIILDSWASAEQTKEIKTLAELNPYQNDRTVMLYGIDTPYDIDGNTKLGLHFNLAEDTPLVTTEMNVLKKNPMTATTQIEKFKPELLTPLKETIADKALGKSPNPKPVVVAEKRVEIQSPLAKPAQRPAVSPRQVVAPISTAPTVGKWKQKKGGASGVEKSGPSKIVAEDSDEIKIGAPATSATKDHLKSLKSTAETKSSAKIVKGATGLGYFEESMDLAVEGKLNLAEELDDFELEPKVSGERRSGRETLLGKRGSEEREGVRGGRTQESRGVNPGKLRKAVREDSESSDLALTTKDSGKVELVRTKAPVESDKAARRRTGESAGGTTGPVYGSRPGGFFRQ